MVPAYLAVRLDVVALLHPVDLEGAVDRDDAVEERERQHDRRRELRRDAEGDDLVLVHVEPVQKLAHGLDLVLREARVGEADDARGLDADEAVEVVGGGIFRSL